MGQNQHGVVVDDIFAQMVFLQDFSLRNGPYHVRALGIHQIHVKIFRPAVLLKQLLMGLRVIPHPAAGIAIGSVALHNRAANLFHHGLPKLRAQEILIALLAGVDLYRHLSRQLTPQRLVQPDNRLRGNLTGKINLCFQNIYLLPVHAKRVCPEGPRILTLCHHLYYSTILTLCQYPQLFLCAAIT